MGSIQYQRGKIKHFFYVDITLRRRRLFFIIYTLSRRDSARATFIALSVQLALLFLLRPPTFVTTSNTRQDK